ncbi:MAG: hypothetical protein N2053_05315 [Chitinispirillaceae bacterium]|nr:hypothetical protein [Chitinispirillaceae bacterium]
MDKIRNIAFCAVFGAAAFLLPTIFHLLHLGSIFMPMYLPLVTLAFFVPPLYSGLTAFILPLLSGILTGMPPFYPPIAIIMSIELSIMSIIISFFYRKIPKINSLILLVSVLFIGRIVNVLLVYLFALLIKLPSKFVAGVSFISGWPGIILMIVVIPTILKLSQQIDFTGIKPLEREENDEKESKQNTIHSRIF